MIEGCELEFEDTFDGKTLDERRWLPYYLPQWSSREAAAARYRLCDGTLRLRIEAHPPARLYTPTYGRFELRARAVTDPRCMVALWMIGYEDEPHRSAEICICEIFGRNIAPGRVGVGMGLHPFGDPAIQDEFSVEDLALDPDEFHVYAAEWTPGQLWFFVDGQLVTTVGQAPDYPMQFMLSLYEFPDGASATPYPKEFVVDYFRGYRLRVA